MRKRTKDLANHATPRIARLVTAIDGGTSTVLLRNGQRANKLISDQFIDQCQNDKKVI
jgi:hypothetical protein